MSIGENNFKGVLSTKMEYIKSKYNISYNSALNYLILDVISNDLLDRVFLTEEHILDNSGDGGLDIGFIDDSYNIIYLIQNKNYNMISPQQIHDAFNKLLDYIKKVKNGNFYEYNEKVINFSNKLKSLINNKDNDITFKLILNTSAKINESAWEKIKINSNNIKKNLYNILDENKKIKIDNLEINDEDELIKKISMMDDEEGIKDEIKLHIKQTGITNKESVLIITDNENQSKTFLTVIDAVKFRNFYISLRVKGKLGSLYAKNVREYFKNKNVDNAINWTLKNNPQDFFILNNGLTIIGKNISHDGNTINITNMCIINGAQTTHLIGESEIDDEELEKVSIFVKIIDIETFNIKKNFNEEEFINKISYATNNQKPIKKEDLITQNQLIRSFVKIFNEMSKHLNVDYLIQIKKSEAIKKQLKTKNQDILNLSSIIKDSLKLLLFIPGTAKSGYSSFLNADSISTSIKNSDSDILWIFKFLNPTKNENKFKYLCDFIDMKKNIATACKQKSFDIQKEMKRLKDENLEISQRLYLLNEFYNTGQNFLESLFIYSKFVLINSNFKKVITLKKKEIINEYNIHKFDEIIQKRINLNILNDQYEIKESLANITNAFLDIFKDTLLNGKTITNAVKEDSFFQKSALIFADQYLTDTNNIYGKDLKIKNFFIKLFNI